MHNNWSFIQHSKDLNLPHLIAPLSLVIKNRVPSLNRFWRLFRYFALNINCDVLIGCSARVIGSWPETLYSHILIHWHTHARTHAHTRTHTHARTQTYTKHTHARTHARTHTHTHTHTHTPLSMPCNGAVVHTWHATVTMPHAVLLLFSDRDYKRQTGYVVSHDNLLIYMDGGEYVQWIFFFQFISQICRIVYSSERRLKWRKNELMNNTSTRTRVLPCKLKYRLKIKYIQNGTICLLNSFFFSSSLSQFYSA